ncbi:hypothetical protein HK405_006635 [Cladochytrium tenue]|nr:hypothetical protein HK405_006635 [Cladochytrium tenue]
MHAPAALAALILAAAAAAGGSPVPGGTDGGSHSGTNYQNYRTWDQAVAKAKSDVAKLSLHDKVVLTTGLGWGWAGYNGNPAFANNHAAGQFNLSVGWTGGQAVCVGNIDKIASINFPGICLQDSPTGVRDAIGVSAFSSAINTAATFDRDLMHRRGEDMGEEYLGKGVHVALQPCVNFMRTPNGGRGWEGFGADPYLQSESVAANVDGVQSKGVQTTVKHYILNDDEWYRKSRSIDIDDKTLHELYLRPFKAAVDAGVTAVMASYNRINDVFASESNYTLGILKNELGFKGYVMTDWWGGHSTLPAAAAGLDMQMAGGVDINNNTYSWYGNTLISAVKSGSISESKVDAMAIRVLSSFYKLGQDKHYVPTNINVWNHTIDGDVNVQGDHADTIREVSAASVVLLKNDKSVLPVTPKKYKKVALIGFGAGPEDKNVQAFIDNFNFGSGWGYLDLYDNSGDGGHGDHGSLYTKDGIYGNIAQGWGSGTTYFPYLVTPLHAFQDKAKKDKYSITYSLNNYDLDNAKKVAAAADIAFVFVGASSGEQYINYDASGPSVCPGASGQELNGNPGDRRNLSTWFEGDALVNAVAGANKKTVVVLNGPGAFDMPWVDSVSAVLHHHFPGQESGSGLADVVFGDLNPSGRLPYTIAKKVSDYPVLATVTNYCSDDGNEWSVQATNYSHTDYKALGNYIDYRYFDKNNIDPLFAFGHGLSYTTFAYSGLSAKVHSGHSSADTTVTVTVTVKNTGSVDGHEVPQLYLGFPSVAAQPVRQLRGFERVFVSAGKSATVKFDLGFDELSYWDGKYKVAPGSYTVAVGASSKDLRVNGSFKI